MEQTLEEMLWFIRLDRSWRRRMLGCELRNGAVPQTRSSLSRGCRQEGAARRHAQRRKEQSVAVDYQCLQGLRSCVEMRRATWWRCAVLLWWLCSGEEESKGCLSAATVQRSAFSALSSLRSWQWLVLAAMSSPGTEQHCAFTRIIDACRSCGELDYVLYLVGQRAKLLSSISRLC